MLIFIPFPLSSDPCMSDDSSLSDVVALDDGTYMQRFSMESYIEVSTQHAANTSNTPVHTNATILSSSFCLTDTDCSPHSPPASGSPSSDSLQSLQGSPKQPPGQTLSSSSSMEDQCSPIQNSPWRETSLDQPYQKPNKPPSPSSSRSR